MAAADYVELKAVPYMGFLVDNLNRFYPPSLKEILVDMISANSMVWRSRGLAVDLHEYKDRVDRRVRELLATERLIEHGPSAGEARIRGTKISVCAITDSIGRGCAMADIATLYPELTERTIDAAITFAGAFRIGMEE